MRENLKFRGKVNACSMVYGLPYLKDNKLHIVGSHNSAESYYDSCHVTDFTVDFVDEFTGYADVNNKEIYENDVVRIRIGNYGYIAGKIVNYKGNWCVESGCYPVPKSLSNIVITDIKVICRISEPNAKLFMETFGTFDAN